MTKEQVIDLMQSSQTAQDWNKNCDTVKAAFNGDYPNWWFEVIIVSGVADKTLAKFGETADMAIKHFKSGPAHISEMSKDGIILRHKN